MTVVGQMHNYTRQFPRDMMTQVTTAEEATTTRDVAAGIVRTMRPRQWVKNAFVIAPLFFSLAFLQWELLLRGTLAFVAFCLAAGSVYIFNDLFDVKKDRRHPIKRHRPIASGQVPFGMAVLSALGAGLLATILAALLDLRYGAVVLTYLIMNLAYSRILKEIAFVDVGVIATGFVLRVLGGAFAIDVFLSEWLFACTFLLALYLGLGKRHHEWRLVDRGKAENTRKVLERYRYPQLDFAVLFVGGLTIAAYTIYTLTAALPDQPLRVRETPFHSAWLPLTIPCTVFGIVRFYQLLQREVDESPTEQILTDRVFIANLFVWATLLGGIVLTEWI